MRNGTTIFDDSFNRNTTLNGGSGTNLPSGTTFSDGTPASYFVQGSIPETAANNGQAQLNAANGILRTQTPPSIPLIQIVNGNLRTGTDPAGPQSLTPANSFSVVGLFDVAVPSVVLGAYQIYLSNNIGQSPPGRGIQIKERQTDTGPVLQFQWNDNAGGLTIISQVALTPAELAEPQLENELSHDGASSDVVTALYAFGSGNTLASFNGILTALGSTDSSTDLFTPTLNWAQSGFEAIDPVPEPSSLAIIASGILGFGAVRRRKKA
ncbi:MAG: PEP-CTERM sorting domain-containing protein [Alphaproteobacteria bacterium]|nr:PEP-CTERM sorting domain-containing protein [Alphaproteobacteria bacterium]